MKKLPVFKKLFFLFGLVFLFLAGLFLPKTVQAASFVSAKDTISTSRPSAAAPISTNLAANATNVWFDNNGSKFLASDSAKLLPDTGETLDTVIIASQGATVGNSAPVYFATKTANTHHQGAAIIVPVTAKHVISFTTINTVPSNGKIKVVFPTGNTTNPASPSASGFSFNNLNSTNHDITISGITCGSWTVTAASGLVQCNLNAGITAPTAISINIGSTTPHLINPTKTAAAGTADTWTAQIKTTDSSDIEIDSTKVKIGTIESVEVFATVDPTLTFTIAGINNNTAVNVGNTDGCLTTETTNTGFNSSATQVNLGVLGSGTVNVSAQLITITTNGMGGYVLTATSSGRLIAPNIVFWLPNAQGDTVTNNDTPAPAEITTGTPAFGIHPCGDDVTDATWSDGDQNCVTAGSPGTCQYANPSPAYYYTLASDSTGPIGNSLSAGNGLITIEYAATISAAVPAGTYRTHLTYVATPTF